MLKGLKILLLSLFGLWLITFVAVQMETHEYAEMSDQQLAQANAYLDGNITPVSNDWQWSTFHPEPEVELRVGMLDVEGGSLKAEGSQGAEDSLKAKGTVIVVPGFTAPLEITMREITRLNQAGYRVAAIEYRGQGESWRALKNPEKGYVEDYAQLASEVADYARSVRIEGRPLFFYSISKGAHITLRLAAENDLDVSGYALIVPMVKLNSGEFPYSATEHLSRLFTHLGLGTVYAPGQSPWPSGELIFGKAGDCNANPDTAQIRDAMFALNPSLRTNGVTMRWLHETTKSTKVLLKPEVYQNITQPIKIFTAGIDTLVDTEATKYFCDSLSQCTLSHFDQSRHCIPSEDLDLYDGIIDDAIRFFDSQL